MRFLQLQVVCFVCIGLGWTRIGRGDDAKGKASIHDEPLVNFSQDIRPLLSDRCFACHGPDENSLEGSLRLDLKESVFGSDTDTGEVPVVPRDADASELIRRITSDDPDERMPPAEMEKQLSDSEKQLLRKWIDQGAPWQEHWAYTAPVRPKLPKVRETSWCNNEIDRFILAKLEKESLHPAPQATRETLLRRVTFDLTGLPPTMADLDAFLEDPSTEAFEKVVDRLIASPAYGEHMARFWLDGARYSDTHGMHYDYHREIWPYRDWVIRAFNDNKPFDQFTIEQLAGDLLENPTNDQLVATGFNRCHVTTSEGGSIEEEVHVRNVVDRVVTTNLVFQASTFDCTRCHDHKFDPFTMKDFYSQFAFFNNLDGPALDGNVKDTYPITMVPSHDQKGELSSIDDRLRMVSEQKSLCRESLTKAWQQWSAESAQRIDTDETADFLLDPTDKLVGLFRFDQLHGGAYQNLVNTKQVAKIHGEMPEVDGRFGKGCQLDEDTYVSLPGPFDCKSNQPFSIGAWIRCPSDTLKDTLGTVLSKSQPNTGVSRYRGYTLAIERGAVAFYLTSDANRYELKVITKSAAVEGDRWQHLFVTYDGSGRAAGVAIYVDGIRQPAQIKLDAIYTKGNPAQTVSKSSLFFGRRRDDFPLLDGVIDDVRIYRRRLSQGEVFAAAYAAEIPSLLALPAMQRTEVQTETLQRFYAHSVDPEYRTILALEDALLEKRRALVAKFPRTLVFQERSQPRAAFLLERGEYHQHGQQVERAVPAFLPQIPEGEPLDRLGYAHWLVSAENPLTSRVQVNRYWQQIFGTGIVDSSGDFGSQGTPPTHPNLLDWLAIEFYQNGWDIKSMIKRMVMSATYRQSSVMSKNEESQAKRQRDPQNRFLSRAPRYRLDAEMIRDQALAVSGLLVDHVGGPSVKPPQPDGLWRAVSMADQRFVADTDPNKTHRRTLYTFIKRTAGPPLMAILDGPTREGCTVQRERTDTPIQALLLMNEPQMIEAAITLAVQVHRHGGPSPSDKANHLYRLCSAQHADEARTKEMILLYEDMRTAFQAEPEEAKKLIGETDAEDGIELAAWTIVANLVLNLDEVLSKN